MSSKEVSQQIANYDKSGYNVNINLPSWNGKAEEQQIVQTAELERKRKNQLYIAIGVLGLLIVAIVFIPKK